MNKLELEVAALVDWLRKHMLAAQAQGLLVGVSGGVDSAVVAALIKRAVPEHALGVILPCFSDDRDIANARGVCASLELAWIEYDLSGAHQAFLPGLLQQPEIAPRVDPRRYRMTDANLRARLRMCALYAVANNLDCLVVGTDNAAETYCGYFTKYGDGGVDLLPLALYRKEEVRAMARLLGIPDPIIEQPPTAGLWPGQTDEQEMGVTYQEIDRLLAGGAVDPRSRERIEELHRRSEHKRHAPPHFIR